MNMKMTKVALCMLALCLIVINVVITVALPDNQGALAAGTEQTTTTLQTTETTTTTTVATTTTEPRQEVVLDLPYYIEIDKIGQIVSVYTTNEEGKYEKLVRQMICSTGESIDKLPDGYYPLKDSKHVWQTMLSHGEPMFAQYTTQITGSFLFHSVPYSANGKKNSLYVERFKALGKANSGGCIRLTVEGAKWIYDNCPTGTPVRVFKGVRDEALLESLRPGDPVNGWDPTDPDPANPDYRPLITTPDPQPDKYAPLYDYNFKWAKEQSRIYLTTTTTAAKTTTTEAPAETTTAAPVTEATAAPEETGITVAP